MKHSGIERPSVGAQLFNIRGGRVIGLISLSERERPDAFTNMVRYAFDLT
jgi:hypothetical protein